MANFNRLRTDAPAPRAVVADGSASAAALADRLDHDPEKAVCWCGTRDGLAAGLADLAEVAAVLAGRGLRVEMTVEPVGAAFLARARIA
jgi:hypothetical protein